MDKFESLLFDADENLKEVKECFIENGYLPSLILGLSVDDSFVAHKVPMYTEGDKNNIPTILNDMALAYSAIILIMDVNVSESDKEIENEEKHIENIRKYPENDPDTASALYCVIYTYGKAMNRIQRYNPETLTFYQDSGWEDLSDDRSKLFLNPYDQINITE